MSAPRLAAHFGHVNLVARDWKRLAAFYETVFGCTPVPPARDYSGPDVAAGTGIPGVQLQGVHLRLPGLSPDGPTLEIYTYTPDVPAGVPPLNRPGFGHLAFGVDDVEAAQAVVLAHGGSAVGAVVTSVTATGAQVTWCYCRDPEGNVVELQRWA